MNICRCTLLFAILGISACHSGLEIRNAGNHFQRLSVSSFMLHEDVRIPPRQAHVSFQRGASEPGSGEFAPHCELEVRQVREEAQTVRAGVFEVTGVRGYTHYVKRRNREVQLAAAEGFRLVSDDSAEWIMLAYHFRLHSDDQPDVMRLICGGAYGFPFYARYPDIEDMQLALGDVGSILLR
jgi:hypothetical protein